MRVALTLHPDSVCDAVTGIEVELVRGPGAEDRIGELRYHVRGQISDVCLVPTERAPDTELWRHTCFELFVRRSEQPNYDEHNFAPSGQCILYRCIGYREYGGYFVLASCNVDSKQAGDRFELRCTPRLPPAHDAKPDRLWRIGLSAVIEETSGRLSYWALHHPPGKPDFHHPDCFALELPPPSAP